MSVRRLAEKQPASFAFTPENRAWAEKEMAKYPPGRQASAIIPLLWRAQAQNGYWLAKPAIELVARMLDMPYIRALEIATFYSMFNLEPVGQYYIQLCGTTPCALRGAGEIIRVCEERVGPQRHVSADGKFSWLEVECLGACCNAPMVQINDDYYEDLTAENFARLLDDLEAGRPVKVGSQTGRVSSEPEPGKGPTLTDAKLYDGSMVGAWRARFEESQKAAAAATVAAANPAAPPAPAAPPPPPAPAAPPADAAAARDEFAKREEAEIAATIAKLPKDATPEQKANAVGEKPAGLAAARDNKADDLQRIRGIGPVNEGKLHALGIYHFDQIAGWSRPQIRWVGAYLAFPGRIDREQWVDQAKALAGGASPEKK